MVILSVWSWALSFSFSSPSSPSLPLSSKRYSWHKILLEFFSNWQQKQAAKRNPFFPKVKLNSANVHREHTSRLVVRVCRHVQRETVKEPSCSRAAQNKHMARFWRVVLLWRMKWAYEQIQTGLGRQEQVFLRAALEPGLLQHWEVIFLKRMIYNIL